jgi:peptide deformylase
MPITTDEAVLRAPNSVVLPEEIEPLEKRLKDELTQSRMPGVGLAAPQIGVNKRIAIVTNGAESLCLANPRIIETRGLLVHRGEACLSVPEKSFNTYRFKEIKVIDDLHPGGFVATGLVAIIIQHEIDHLDGVLIMDRMAHSEKIGRNDPCPCGSKVKFKKCHGRDP